MEPSFLTIYTDTDGDGFYDNDDYDADNDNVGDIQGNATKLCFFSQIQIHPTLKFIRYNNNCHPDLLLS